MNVIKKVLRANKKFTRVIVTKSGNMVSILGKKLTWSQISKNAKFTHKK